MIVAVKADALQRARQSFNPSAFEVVFKTVESNIAAATDKAAVDALISNFAWPE